jgi:type I restriction enzyme, S subunit
MTKLPEGWEVKRLDEIADVVMGQSPPGSSYNEHGEGQPFFQGKTEFGEVHPTVRKYTTAGTKFAKAGDILMSVRAPVGPTNIADIDCVIGRGLAAIRAKSVVSQSYLRWTLKHLEIDIQLKGTGTTFDAITGETLRSTLIALPPLAEQQEIVAILEDHLSRLDVALADVKQARVKSAQFRQSLLNSVFYGSKFNSVNLGSCIELIMGQAPPGITCNTNGEGTPFVKVGEFAKLYPTIEEWTLKPLRFAKTGDVLICVVGATVGKINLGIDCAIGRSVAAIRPKNVLLQKYLYHFLELKMLEIRGQSKGSAQGVITKDYINSIQIPLPELKVQEDILDLLELNFSQIEKSVEVSNIIERESLSLRRSLLQAAFTGQLAKEVANV